MTESQPPPQTPTTQDAKPPIIIDAAPNQGKPKTSEDKAMECMNELQEDVGQISELTAEEENLVTRFFDSLFRIMKPFGKTLEISTSALPENCAGKTSKAYLYLTGELVLVHASGEVEVLDLSEQENHDVLVRITGEIMAKLKVVINSYKSKTENRVKFLMAITKELQKVAEVFSKKQTE